MFGMGVFLDPSKCIGCKHCEIACAVEHSKEKELLKAIAEKPAPKNRILVEASPESIPFPAKCNHCETPLCVRFCPTGAMRRDERSGIVTLDESLCVGCGMCGLACPFGVILYTLKGEKRVAIKCDGCTERIEKGVKPACVEACKTGALMFGPYEEIVKEKRIEMARRVSPYQDVEACYIPDEVLSLRKILSSMSELKKREVQP